MSDSDHTDEEKKHPFSALLFSLIILTVLASSLFYQSKKANNDTPYDEFNLLEAVGFAPSSSHFDLEKVSAPRIIGNIQAPVKITEYSSFTCGACGLYRKAVFEKIKENYIDTGKAYLVFSDMPRNVQDVTISAIARCVPEKSYLKFLDLVFENQKEWMESENPAEQIKEKAIIAGASTELIDQCYYSEELRKTLVKDAQEALGKHDVEHVPSLAINDMQVVMGIEPYEKIRDVIEEALAKVEALAKEEELKAAAVTPIPEEVPEEENKAAQTSIEGSVADNEAPPPLVIEVVDTDNNPVPMPKALADIESSAGEEAMQDGLNIEELVKPRILGNPDAPLKISDYSSYTCGACGKFHLDAFNKIKTEYIDTGKAYLVFDDFPRNGHDITIGAVARCVPEKAYFKFVDLIYKTQDTWIMKSDYINFIKQNAKLTGADPELIDKCAESEALQEALAARGQHIYEDLGVDSTPTFIINDEERIVGAVSYSQFKKTLNAELAKAKAKHK